LGIGGGTALPDDILGITERACIYFGIHHTVQTFDGLFVFGFRHRVKVTAVEVLAEDSSPFASHISYPGNTSPSPNKKDVRLCVPEDKSRENYS
jgi:hypothetical protein